MHSIHRTFFLAAALALVASSPAAAAEVRSTKFAITDLPNVQVGAEVSVIGTSGRACVRLYNPLRSDELEHGCGQATVVIDDTLQHGRVTGSIPSKWQKTTYSTVTTTTGKGRHKSTQTETVASTTTGNGAIKLDFEWDEAGQLMPLAPGSGLYWCINGFFFSQGTECDGYTWAAEARTTTETRVRGIASGTLVDSGSREGRGTLASHYVLDTGVDSVP